MKTEKKPELLAPAGSPEALNAAIAGGADAVYFGGSLFNARMNAKNFAGDTLREAIDKCRLYGIKTNITLNTLVYDREMSDVLKYVEELYIFGADALIVADLGVARLIHRYFPDFELHASTQAMGHNTDAAKILSEMGFSRMVAARELSLENLRTLCENSPIETEIFIHGAICVSQSGGCLASSLIGGRSGNRGECAQPCRLPYKCESCKKETYALSLKDICLASHIPEILSLGAASLKIEGRMKSPDYVYGVTRIYRKLLDEGRNATAEELENLRLLFSRSGFTDGYFSKNVGRKMLGIRTDSDKADSSAFISAKHTDYSSLAKEQRRPADLSLRIEADKPSLLTVTAGGVTATVSGAVPDKAVNQPLTPQSVRKNIEKLGSTPFYAKNVDIILGDGLIMPLSSVNALRREAIGAVCEAILKRRKSQLPEKIDQPNVSPSPELFSARFQNYESIPENVGKCTLICIPLEKFSKDMKDKVNCVIIPPVIFDSETAAVKEMLTKAHDAGIRHAFVSNLGHIKLARNAGMTLHGDFRLNVFNNYSREALCKLGFESLIASPELSLPKLRDLGVAPVIYGRIPLMTLEKCVIRDIYSCEDCEKREFLPLIDRKGVKFPLTRSFEHRNILYNSVPVYMQDKKEELIRYNLKGAHYIFTDESTEIAEAILTNKQLPLPMTGIRRIPK